MKVVAVTSCATGIAHTYMAAEAIMKVCKERGYKCKVEKQGALGLEDKLRDRDIKEADLIVFANDKSRKIRTIQRQDLPDKTTRSDQRPEYYF